jgi:branched-chain amino acid transport system permease protein
MSSYPRKSSVVIASGRSTLRSQTASLGALAVIFVLLPVVVESNELLQLATLALIFAIPVIGLSLLYGEGGQMSVAGGALYGVGAYVCAIGVREKVLSFWTALPCAAAAGALAAFLVGLTALRVKGHYFLIVTFAFAELWRISLVNLKGITGGNQGVLVLDDIRLPGLGEIQSLTYYYYLAVIFALLAAYSVVILRFSSFGRSLRVIRENERLAVSLGLNTAMVRLAAFALSGALAGIGGTLYAYNVKHIGPDLFGSSVGIQIILVLLIGGSRSPVGPMLGSLVFFLLPEFIGLDPVSTQIVYGVVLILIVMVSPDGLAPALARMTKRAIGYKVTAQSGNTLP